MAATLDMPSLGKFYRRQLLEDVLPFWFPRAYDEKNGGLYHCFDADGTLVDSDKSVWAQGRMAWMLLTMYNSIEKNTDWLKWAESALEFLKTKCVDPADGRMFFHVAADGTPIYPYENGATKYYETRKIVTEAGGPLLSANRQPGFCP